MTAAKTRPQQSATKTVSLRLEPDAVKRVDQLAYDLSRPGLTVTRADALLQLVLDALPRFEKRAAATKAKR